MTEELRVSANSWTQQQFVNTSARQSLSNSPLTSSSTNTSSKYDGFPARKKLDRSAKVDTANISELAKWMQRNTSNPNPGTDSAGSGQKFIANTNTNQTQPFTINSDVQIGSGKQAQAAQGQITLVRESLENYQKRLDRTGQGMNSASSKQALNTEAIFKVQDARFDNNAVQNTSPTRQLLLRSTQAALRHSNQSTATGTLVNLYR